MRCHDFEVSISNDDEGSIPEYASRLDNEYTVSCFIPSEAGKHFKINFINLTTHFFAEARCYIDGRLLTRTVVRPMTRNWADGVQVTSTTVRPFLFSFVQISDDEQDLSTVEHNVENIGTIEVHILRIVQVQEEQWTGQMKYPEIGPMHENTKKAGSHQVSLGKAEPSSPILRAHASFVDFPERPRAKFIYHYRPRDVLQAQGIIPLPPAASSSRTSRASSLERQPPQRKRSHSIINDEPYMKKRRVADPERDHLPSGLDPEPPSPPPHSAIAELYPELYGDTLGDDLAALEEFRLKGL